jgi:hypothetical protein
MYVPNMTIGNLHTHIAMYLGSMIICHLPTKNRLLSTIYNKKFCPVIVITFHRNRHICGGIDATEFTIIFADSLCRQETNCAPEPEGQFN